MRIKTAHGYLSFQPDGRVEYRDKAGPWEELDLEGLVIGVEVPGPSPIGPGPVIDPLFGCQRWANVTDGNYQPLVACLCTHLNPAGSKVLALEVVRRVAWALRAQGAGLLRKDGGENIADYYGTSVSLSRILFQDGRLVKVLTDVPTTNGPSWQEEDALDPRLWVEPRDPGV
jgi:hypothetical protein